MWKTLAAVLTGISLVAQGLASAAEKTGPVQGPPDKVLLTTDYLSERVDVAETPFGGHWLRLNVTLDNVGGGKGTLVIDPNSQGFNDFGDPRGVTEIATFSVDITVEAVKVEDPAQKGRRLYELMGSELKTRLFLVVSPREAGPSRLIVRGKDKGYVFPLQGGVISGVKGDGPRRPLDSSR
jgi:hypothetical protein